MKVQDAMTPNVGLVAPNSTAMAAAQMMRDLDVGALPVGNDDRLVGMVTDRDLVVRGLAEGADPASLEVQHCMTPQVLYCYADQPVEEVAANMAEQQIRRLPVVDRNKRLVGIIALADISTAIPPKRAGKTLRNISSGTHN